MLFLGFVLSVFCIIFVYSHSQRIFEYPHLKALFTLPSMNTRLICKHGEEEEEQEEKNTHNFRHFQLNKLTFSTLPLFGMQYLMKKPHRKSIYIIWNLCPYFT